MRRGDFIGHISRLGCFGPAKSKGQGPGERLGMVSATKTEQALSQLSVQPVVFQVMVGVKPHGVHSINKNKETRAASDLVVLGRSSNPRAY